MPAKTKQRVPTTRSPRSEAARKAWRTRRTPSSKARASERASKKALGLWALAEGWRVVFLDAPSGAPRTGIIDALLLRIRPRAADQLDLALVQLKAGSAGITGAESHRLRRAAQSVNASAVAALWDGRELAFWPDSP